MDRLTIRSRLGDYIVDVRDDTDWVAELCELDHAFFVVDERVWGLHGRGCLAPMEGRAVHLMPATEESKTLEGVSSLCDALISQSAKRSTVVVSVGGGVVQDATGFLASVIYRGVRWVYVPTTLLAQADSCIGAKTSINYRHFKNLLGTMYPPRQIVVHPAFAETLDEHQYFSGLGEILKMHIAAGEPAMARLDEQIVGLVRREPDAVSRAVLASLQIKKEFIEEDEFDYGRRQLLNFGHCFGHAIESATDFAVPHGQAVALGMILAGLVSRSRGQISEAQVMDYTARYFARVLTSAADIEGINADAVLEAMAHDKKRAGSGLAVVLPLKDWSLILARDVTEAEARRALGELPEVLVPETVGRPEKD